MVPNIPNVIDRFSSHGPKMKKSHCYPLREMLAVGKVRHNSARIILGKIKNLVAREKREVAMEEKL